MDQKNRKHVHSNSVFNKEKKEKKDVSKILNKTEKEKDSIVGVHFNS